MANSFTPTAAYSNLTRLELEQLRKADGFAGGKATTIGDSANGAENVVGPGSLTAEPYGTSPTVLLDAVYALTPPTEPGTKLSTLVSVGNTQSELLKWIGPDLIVSGQAIGASGSYTLVDPLMSFVAVQAGDIVVLRALNTGSSLVNQYGAGVVQTAVSHTLTFSRVYAPNSSPTDRFAVDGSTYYYTIIRPNAVQLFAVPGSGPTGEEQTFLTVIPGSTLHTTLGPTLDAINADRLSDLVPPMASESTLRDRADAVYGAPAPSLSGQDLGYRVILYPDNGSGAPDIAHPLSTLNPIIDPAIPSADQRFTVDYRAGVIRFSCAPKVGGDIKVAGGVNSTTGRLNLYAVFFAFDQSLTGGDARGLYGVRTTEVRRPGAKVFYNSTTDAWHLTENTSGEDFFVQALDNDTDYRRRVSFGAQDPVGSSKAYFVYDLDAQTWRFKAKPTVGSDPSVSMEMTVADKTAVTVGDISSPALAPADLNATSASRGARDTSSLLTQLLQAAPQGYGVVHLRRGKHNLSSTLYVPPGIILEGEGDNTVIDYMPVLDGSATKGPAIKFGPNNQYGTYDFSHDGSLFHPTTINTSFSSHVEGTDMVWNSVRRVWAIFWADATTHSIWFHEIAQDGTPQFSAGLNVKDNSNALFTATSTDRPWHTTGHYPRVAFHEPTDTYAVTWVEEQTLDGELGPKGMFAIVQTDIDTRDVRPGPQSSAYTFIQAPIEIDPGIFTTHPSVAASETGAATYRFAVTYWNFNVRTVGTFKVPASSRVGSLLIGPTLYRNRATYQPAPKSLISSTDVSGDGRGGFLLAWSRHKHAFFSGSAAQIVYSAAADGRSVTLDSWTQPAQPYPAPAPSATIALTVAASDSYRVGDTVYLSRPVHSGNLTLTNQYSGDDLGYWGTVTQGDWITIAGDPNWHRVASVVGTTLVIEGSIFPVSSGTFAYTVWAGPQNAGPGHQVAKYLVDQVLVGATTELRLRGLDYQTIPAGTNFSGSTAILRAVRNHIVDATVADWSELLGSPTDTYASPTSKYHRLGRALAPVAYGAGQELNFGSDFGAYSIGEGLTAFDRLYVRSWPQGFPVEPNGTEYFLYGTLFSLVPCTVVQGGTVLTDLTANFVSLGVQAGDWIVTGTAYAYRILTVTPTTLTITGDVFREPSGSIGYCIVAGAHHEAWAVTPQTFIEGTRIFGSGDYGSTFVIAGQEPDPITATTSSGTTTYTFPGTTYHQAQYEPDFVRLSRGTDKWIAVYQAMRTTAQLATPTTVNWANWTSTSAQVIPVGDRGGVYREHVSVCYAVVEDFAGIAPDVSAISAPSAVDNRIGPSDSGFYLDVIRDVNVSNRSLGTRAPIVHRPNLLDVQGSPTGALLPEQRTGHTFNNEIGCLNYMHRWTSTRMPSLVPDVTWTGEDWSIVSPTKRVIEAYTGVYQVDGAGNVFLRDATFMFGSGASPTVGTTTFLRHTFTGSVYFPSADLTVTATVVDEHTIQLAGNPLFQAPNTQTTNNQWVMVGAGPTQTGAGVKNLGYRVSLDGAIILSSQYNTFAEEPAEDAYTGSSPQPPRRQETLAKNAGGAFFGLYTDASIPGVPVPAPELLFSKQATTPFLTMGQNAPSCPITEGFEEGGRYIANVGFQGVAPGEPLSLDHRNRTQDPFVALAWGDTFYGLVTHATYSGSKELRVYRQSFGPYNNGLRNIRVVNHRPASSYDVGSGDTSTVALLSREWVHTRHGAPVANTHRFATDGFRNVWAYPHHKGTKGVLDGNAMNLRYVYSDAFGRDSIQMDGPESLSGLTGAQAPFASDIVRETGDTATTGWFGVSSPKVIWDGTRYVVAWTEGGGLSGGTPMVCLAVAPGHEDGGPQTAELGLETNVPFPYQMSDLTRLVRVQAAVTVATDATSASTLTTLDIASSGQTYAVLWVSGIDTQQGSMPGAKGAILGVTIFDQLASGATGLDFDAQHVVSGRGSAKVGTLDDMDFTITRIPGTSSYVDVSIGDIVVVTELDDTNPGTNAIGAYVVRLVDPDHITLDRSLPYCDVLAFVVRRPSRPAGGQTYVLGTAQVGVYGESRWKPYRHPKIIWTGHEYVAFWMGDQGATGSGAFAKPFYTTLQRETFFSLSLPEHGLGAAQQTKLATSESGPYFGNTQCVGILQVNTSAPTEMYFGYTLTRVDTGLGATINLTVTGGVIRSAPNFVALGVQPGDLLFVANALATGYDDVYVIEDVISESAIQLNRNPGTNENNRAFFILKQASNVRVRPGDTVRIDTLKYDRLPLASYYTKANGTHSITNLDTYTRTMNLSPVGTVQPYPSTLNYPFGYLPVVHGEILSGSTADGNFAVETPSKFFGSPTPNPRGLVVPHNPYVPRDILGFTHNDRDDEYAVIWSGRDGSAYGLFVSFFSANMEAHIRTTTLWSGEGAAYQSNDPFVGDIAWNGEEYLVVYTPAYSTYGGELLYRTVHSHLQGPVGSLGTLGTFLYGSGAPISDGRYGNAVVAGKAVRPAFTGSQVLWNPRLGRWVVSVSVSWFYHDGSTQEARDSVGGDSFNRTVPLNQTILLGFSPTDPHVLLLNAGADYSKLQPGTRLVIQTETIGGEVSAMIEKVGSGQITVSTWNLAGFNYYDLTATGTGTWAGGVSGTLTDLSGPGPFANYVADDKVLINGQVGTVTFWTDAQNINITFPVAISSGSHTYVISKPMHLLPREDVFCVTLGSPYPTVSFEDADGAYLENVTLSGATTIEEKYTHMSRPMWQSGGMAVGNWSLPERDPPQGPPGDNILATHKPPGYNHRFLTPSGKVGLPRFTNVRQIGRNQSGSRKSIRGGR